MILVWNDLMKDPVWSEMLYIEVYTQLYSATRLHLAGQVLTRLLVFILSNVRKETILISGPSQPNRELPGEAQSESLHL